tara:strand:- start:356 stop:883 length:528 start_codon:yes stop_codon:yes gene_type:complete
MKDRYEAVTEIYCSYVRKHLGDNPLQNILVTGGMGSVGWYPEIARHKFLTYDNLFHFEVGEIDKGQPRTFHDQIINEDIFWPTNPIESVNLIYADPSPTKNPTKDGIEKILEGGFVNNKLGILVFLYFDGIGIEPFLDKQYGYKSEDFFSKDIDWYDEHNNATYSQRLDGVVFYD